MGGQRVTSRLLLSLLLALSVMVPPIALLVGRPALADVPAASATPIGYGNPPSQTVTDPIFAPFKAEYIVTASEWDTSFYFPSNGDGTFGTKSTVISGNSDGAAIADFDNDGDLDFVIGAGFSTIILYRNDGGGIFNPVTVASSVPAYFHTQMRAADFNKDGKIDFTSGSLWASGGPQRVYLNQGDLVSLIHHQKILPRTSLVRRSKLGYNRSKTKNYHQ